MATILITGATDGLGRALAGELDARGHDVVVHGRSRERADAVAAEIGGAHVEIADFARLDDVRALAERVQGIDVLVNNAGIIAAERQLSEDGHELTFQVNHLAGFLLTLLVLPPRTVNVASIGQQAPDFDDLMLEHGYEGYRAYAQSKLAQIMFTFELAERRRDLVVNALHPATLMDTKMVHEWFGRTRSTVAEGVEATAALVERDDISGRFFDGLRESRADPVAYEGKARRRLWDVSAQLTSAPPLAR
ncbi:MAG TPA: SDR family NAD(P)-dependent oxidoreductase [Solirubrobacteraceae bacterium]|nr:SDR family NAD(P)-dependent oxidoreductase [Solirubrobacteraceae bacterium]